jgi:hypothetical protein
MAVKQSTIDLATKANGGRGDWANFMVQYAADEGLDTNKQSDLDKIRSAYQNFRSAPPDTGDTGDKGKANFFQKGAGTIIGGLADVAKSFESREYMMGVSEEIKPVSSMINSLLDSQGNLKGIKDILKDTGGLIKDGILQYFQTQSDLLRQINREAGLTGKFSKDLRDELTQTNPELIRIGIGFSELAQSQKSLVSDSGRFLALNRESWKEAGIAATAYVGTLSDLVSMFPKFEEVGIGASEVAEQVKIAGGRSIELGLQSQKITAGLKTEIGKLNEFGFKNGVQGLTEMVRKSTEFRMNMDSVFKIAEDVFDPDKAINLSANLQAIGGAIGDFNDPLKLMYMATNNVEGLQDALIGVAGSLATYNEEQGRFEITGVNLRKAKAMAQELGISYQELAKGAVAAAERSSASAALMASGLNLDEDTKRFLTNISTMKDGKMTIQLQGEEMRKVFGANEIALENLTSTQLQQLKQYQDEFKELTPEQIIEKQATDVENMSRNVNYIAALLRNQFGGAAQQLKKDFGLDPIESLAKKVKESADKAAPFIKEGGQQIRDYITSSANKMKSPESVPVDNKNTTKTETETQNKNLNASGTVVVEHRIGNSEVVGDTARRVWEQSLSMQDPREYVSFSDATYVAPRPFVKR